MAGLYVDTKRSKQDLPNAFSALVEGGLSYRVPQALMWQRARLDALTKSTGDARAANDALVQLTQEKVRLQTALADLESTEIGARTQVDTNVATITAAGLGAGASIAGSNASLKSQDSQARTEAYKTDAGVFTNRSGASTTVSAKGRELVDRAKSEIDQMSAALENAKMSDEQRAEAIGKYEENLATIKKDLDRALGSSDPGEAQAAQNEIATYSRGAVSNRGVNGARTSARVNSIFAANAPEFQLREADVGVKGGVGFDVADLTGKLVDTAVEKSPGWRIKNGGSSSTGSASELTRTGGSEPESDAKATIKKGIDDIDELMRTVREDSKNADPFRGLGGFFDPIPTKGSSSVRARTSEEEPPPPEAKKAKAKNEDMTWEEEDLLPRKRRKKRSKQGESVVFTSDATNDNRIV
jgi:hypothetical protein